MRQDALGDALGVIKKKVVGGPSHDPSQQKMVLKSEKYCASLTVCMTFFDLVMIAILSFTGL